MTDLPKPGSVWADSSETREVVDVIASRHGFRRVWFTSDRARGKQSAPEARWIEWARGAEMVQEPTQ